MKFEKISLEQFTKDYLYCKYNNTDREISEVEKNEISTIWRNIKLPERSTSGSAGYDFFIPYTQFFSPLNETLIPTGIKFECDEDKFLMCVPRSGLGFKYSCKLSNTCGIIDSDYYNNEKNEGHIMCKVECKYSFELNQGKALMQGIILPYYKVEDDLSDGVRDGGFGSTGV